MGVVEEYWSGVTAQLQVEAEVLNRLISHNGEMGRANELSLAGILERLLPPNLAVGTGIVFDSEGRESGQCDLVIFDRHKTPQLLAQSGVILHPVDTVAMVIEVKTTLNADECADVVKKARAISSLKPTVESSPAVVLFAFGTSLSAYTSSAHLEQAAGEAPGLKSACVLNPGLVSHRDENGDLKVRAVPVHQREADGRRKSREWAKGEKQARNQLHGDGLYPVESLGANFRKDLVLLEPGRALLLHSLDLLQILHDRGAVSGGWWHQYVDNTTAETAEFIRPSE